MLSVSSSWIEQDASGEYRVIGETSRNRLVSNQVLADCGSLGYCAEFAQVMLDLARGVIHADLTVGKSANYTYDFRVQCVGSAIIRDAEIIAFFLVQMGRCIVWDITCSRDCVTQYSLLHLPGVSPLTMHGVNDQWFWMKLDLSSDEAPQTDVVNHDTAGDVLLLSGDTYRLRAEIRTLFTPLIYDKLRGGWLIPIRHTIALHTFADEHDCTVTSVPFEMDSEAKRNALVSLHNTKRDRLHERLDRLQTVYNQCRDTYKSFTSDNAFLTQPILTGHHSEAGHRKLKAKISANEDRKQRLLADIKKITQQIAHLDNPQTHAVKGDTKRRDAAKIKHLDELLSVGSRVHSYLYGVGTIIKVNKASYQVRWDKGFANKIAKILCEAIT